MIETITFAHIFIQINSMNDFQILFYDLFSEHTYIYTYTYAIFQTSNKCRNAKWL